MRPTAPVLAGASRSRLAASSTGAECARSWQDNVRFAPQSIDHPVKGPAMPSPLAPGLPARIPSLDGLRALSIALVIVGHCAATSGAPGWLDRPMFTSLGNVGVRIFFLISGFLITTLLLRDVDKYGRIRIGLFYERRALRILPAALSYIAVIWILYLDGMLDLTFHNTSRQNVPSAIPDLIHALTFTANYQLDYNWYFNHLWSLSVEEQFYLLWPAALLLLGTGRAFAAACAILALAPLARLLMYAFGNVPEIALSREFQAVADALATGCLASMAYNRILASPRGAKLLAWPALPTGLGLVALGYGVAFVSRPLSYLAGQTSANLGIALVLLHLVTHPGRRAGRLLGSAPLVAIGTLSYSLYLWQEPFLYFRNSAWIGSFPQNVVFAVLAALASYFIVERPFLAIKDGLARARRGG
jgi:peptidoglycan/LPS O-acetylase OafA/YrhL